VLPHVKGRLASQIVFYLDTSLVLAYVEVMSLLITWK